MSESKSHWDTVYTTKQPHEVSWTQEVPQTSIDLIRSFRVQKSARIIDIGGGDSRLVDCLLDEGYVNVTVLDISAMALERAKARLGERAHLITWIAADITEFNPKNKYDVWHDRAAFHFLTTPNQITSYLHIARRSVSGYMAMGTFSENGPTKCSGLEIKQYTEDQLQHQLSDGFKKIRCLQEDHVTPFGTKQNFLFCSFRRA